MPAKTLNALILGAFCMGLGACATPPEQQYQVATPPRPRLDAKSELEDGKRIRQRQQQAQ